MSRARFLVVVSVAASAAALVLVPPAAAARRPLHPIRAGGSSSAGRRHILVSPPVDISNEQNANNEESLGMDPTGQILFGAWNDWEYNDGCGISFSTDGGDTWARESFVPGLTAFTNDPSIPGTGRFGIAGDPAVVYNPKSGLFDIVCQSFGTKTGHQIQLLSTTFDWTKADPNADPNESYGAAAWTTPVAVATGRSNGSQKGSNGKTPDHETITVDTGQGPGHHYGRLFVGWAEFSGSGRSPIEVAYSDDDGQTWTGPIRVSDVKHKFAQDARPSVGPDGTVYMTWVSGPNEKSLKNNVVVAAKSTDGGQTWSKNAEAAPIEAPVPGSLPNSNYRVFTDVWSVVDQARGVLVVAFTDERTGPSNIYVTHTLSAGDITNWSTPVAVKPSGQEEFFPWLSSAPGGRVDLVFYDRSCDPNDTLNCLTLVSSSDGATTWTITPLLTTGFDGDQFQACLAFVDPPDCGVFFLGDYIAVGSTDAKAQVLYTGNGAAAQDAFSIKATF